MFGMGTGVTSLLSSPNVVEADSSFRRLLLLHKKQVLYAFFVLSYSSVFNLTDRRNFKKLLTYSHIHFSFGLASHLTFSL